MNGRSASALVAMLALVTTVFAGCVQPDWLNSASSKTEISALENKDLADNAAKAWNEKAGLLSVFSMELGQNQGQDNIPLDPAVGNGKAPVWFYVYCVMDSASPEPAQPANEGTYASDSKTTASSAPEMAVFRVMSDGTVHQENDSSMGMGAPMPQGDMKDISSWKVDSPAALDAAKTNKTFLTTLNAPNASLAEGVAWIEGKSAWYFAAGGESGITVAIIDAATGKLLEVRAMKLDLSNIPSYARPNAMPMAPPLKVEGKGTVVSNDAKGKEFPFTYDGGPTLAQLKISSNGRLPGDGLTWKLLGPDGKEVKAKGSSPSSGSSSRGQGGVMQYALENAGAYKLVFQYRGPTSMTPIGAPMPLGSTDFSFALSNEFVKQKPQEN